MPHLVRARSTYKDIRIHSFHHTHMHTHNTHIHTHTVTHTHAHTHRCTCTCTRAHTHYKHMHYWWWVGKMTDQYAEEKRWVFSFDLREWRRMPYREAYSLHYTVYSSWSYLKNAYAALLCVYSCDYYTVYSSWSYLKNAYAALLCAYSCE